MAAVPGKDPKGAAAWLQLLQRAAMAANQARTAEDAFERVLGQVCAGNRWKIGHVHALARDGTGRMLPTAVWHNPDRVQLEPFVRTTMRMVFEPGQGVLGRVCETESAVWVRWTRDVGQESEWLRSIFVESGLRTGALFPVVADGGVVAILELFSFEEMAPDPLFLAAMETIGLLLGHVLDRRHLERQVSDLAEQEQQRLGRELHDSLGQQLAGLGMLADSLRRKLAARESPELEIVDRLVATIRDAQRETRALAKGLMPVEVDANGLMMALHDLAAGASVMYGTACAFECRQPVPLEDNRTATHLYRIAQEAIHNAVEHGGATRIVIRLDRKPDGLVLEISDNGCGFQPKPPRQRGVGLRIMRHRAAMIGATVEIGPGSQDGTVVRCVLAR